MLPIGLNANGIQQTLGAIVTKSSSFSIALEDDGRFFLVTTAAGAVTATLPSSASIDFRVSVQKKSDLGVNYVAIAPPSGETINDSSPSVILMARGDRSDLVKTSSTNWELINRGRDYSGDIYMLPNTITHTGSTSTTTLGSVTFPAGLITARSTIKFKYWNEGTNNANNKTFRMGLQGGFPFVQVLSGSTGRWNWQDRYALVNSTNNGYLVVDRTIGTAVNAASATNFLDFSNDVIFDFNAQLAVATDSLILRYLTVTLN